MLRVWAYTNRLRSKFFFFHLTARWEMRIGSEYMSRSSRLSDRLHIGHRWGRAGKFLSWRAIVDETKGALQVNMDIFGYNQLNGEHLGSCHAHSSKIYHDPTERTRGSAYGLEIGYWACWTVRPRFPCLIKTSITLCARCRKLKGTSAAARKEKKIKKSRYVTHKVYSGIVEPLGELWTVKKKMPIKATRT